MISSIMGLFQASWLQWRQGPHHCIIKNTALFLAGI
jgi:hypothetical protein